MANCKELEKKIDFLDYTEKDLLKLFNTYNNCMFTDPDYISREDKNRISFHVFAGVDITYFNFIGRDFFSHLENSSFDASVTPLAGVRLIIPLQRKKKQMSLVADVANRNISLASSYAFESSTYDVDMYMDYVKLNAGLRYKLRTPSVEPYFNGGIAFNYLVDFVSTKVQTDSVDGERETTYDVAILDPHPFDFGFFAGVGLHYKRFNLEGRFEKSIGNSPSFDFDVDITTVNIFLSYRLSSAE
jgi:hypothetical protein